MSVAKRIPVLVYLLGLGALLRFWCLDLKPLWMDEVITGIFSLGRNYYDIPLQTALPIAAYEQFFAFNPQATCPQIVETVATQSVHPPLFFCWMHQWLGWVNGWAGSWIWQLRALPALIGVVAIAAVYHLNRVAFSVRAAWMGGLVMAVSPFAVYLSQEARHYTLPMLLVALALIGLHHILVDLHQQRLRPLVWLGWIGVNSLGFYVHYFFLLALAAQGVTLGLLSGQSAKPRVQSLAVIAGAIALIGLTYVPWLPTFLSHMNRPETDWIAFEAPGLQALAPLVQLVVGWVLMVVALPIENQPFWFIGLSAVSMAIFLVWFVQRITRGIWQSWHTPETQFSTQMLLIFTATVIVEFLAIAYLLGKDLTQAPRYNFIYFPALCALIGTGLSTQLSATEPRTPEQLVHRQTRSRWQWVSSSTRWCDRQAIWVVLLVGILSSSFVVNNYVFHKPYRPEQIAQTLTFEPNVPLFVVSAYKDFQDLALGLSLALPLAQPTAATPPTPINRHFAFLAILNGYGSVWQGMTQVQAPFQFPLNLWVIAPGLKRVGYPEQLQLQDGSRQLHQCQIDTKHHYRLGIPYQLYRCR